MKAIDWAINKYPAGTVFSMSFGTDESAFGGASAATQFTKFDQTFQRGLAKTTPSSPPPATTAPSASPGRTTRRRPRPTRR